jgi:hypothetical protein
MESNYYTILKKGIKRRYPEASKEETGALCREAVFAPTSYVTEISQKAIQISTFRENVADSIEAGAVEKNFIPYSLDAEIADLIEQTNCETSSMNEYYRWISATADIVKNTSDGEVTPEDLRERKDFLSMSNEREAEILLCLALYEASGPERNKQKIDMLTFKLARLREMRSIVRNTNSLLSRREDRFHKYCEYCNKLLQQNFKTFPDINSKLKINPQNGTEEDVEEDVSFMDLIQESILRHLHGLNSSDTPREQRHDSCEKQTEKDPLPAAFFHEIDER